MLFLYTTHVQVGACISHFPARFSLRPLPAAHHHTCGPRGVPHRSVASLLTLVPLWPPIWSPSSPKTARYKALLIIVPLWRQHSRTVSGIHLSSELPNCRLPTSDKWGQLTSTPAHPSATSHAERAPVVQWQSWRLPPTKGRHPVPVSRGALKDSSTPSLAFFVGPRPPCRKRRLYAQLLSYSAIYGGRCNFTCGIGTRDSRGQSTAPSRTPDELWGRSEMLFPTVLLGGMGGGSPFLSNQG